MKNLIFISIVFLAGCSLLNVKDGKFEGKAVEAGKRVGKSLDKDAVSLRQKIRHKDGKKLICVKKEDCPKQIK